MKYFKNNLKRSHIIVFACMLVIFMIMTFLISNTGLNKGTGHNVRVLLATVGTVAGPMTGAFSRGCQSCCLKFSLQLMIYCAPLLIIGVLAQFIGSVDKKWVRVTKMTIWISGWLVWFMGGIISFGHALS